MKAQARTSSAAPVDAEAPPIAAPARVAAHLGAWIELTKPRICSLVLVSVVAGYYMGVRGPVDLLLLLHTLVGAGLVGAGANAINMVRERDFDALMERTRGRPIPSGRLSVLEASVFGWGVTAVGLAWLAYAVNPAAFGVALFTSFSYLFIYTPMKRVTDFNTMIGAVPGALPPLIGWAAATGGVSAPGVTLFAILYFWQIPHFFAIAWLYREDYLSGGFKMIAGDDPGGERISVRVAWQCLALITASITPTLQGLTRPVYSVLAVVLGVVFLVSGLVLARTRTKRAARIMLRISVIHLPLLLILMMALKIRA